jgi:hypothetical protein
MRRAAGGGRTEGGQREDATVHRLARAVTLPFLSSFYSAGADYRRGDTLARAPAHLRYGISAEDWRSAASDLFY